MQDARGVPVPRALVTLQGLGIARTNSLGQYQFVNVPAGLQQLSIAQPGAQTRFEKVQVTTSTNEVKTRFAPGDKQNSTTGRATLMLSSGGTTITGSVVDEANRSLAAVRITAIRDQSAVTVAANSAGSFELRNLKPGAYRLIAIKAGYDTAVLNVTLSSVGGAPVRFQLKQSSSPLASALLRHPAPPGGVIRGRVLAPDGGIIVNAIVSIKPAAGSTPTTIRTNQNGEFRFSLPEGQYEIRVGHDSYQAVSRLVEAKSGGTTQSDFYLKPTTVSISSNRPQSGQTTSSLSAIPVRTGGVVVQVVDARTGRPIAGATISFAQQQASTNPNGAVSLANLSPGNYQLTVARTGYLPNQRVLSIIAGQTARLNVALTPQPSSPQGIRRN